MAGGADDLDDLLDEALDGFKQPTKDNASSEVALGAVPSLAPDQTAGQSSSGGSGPAFYPLGGRAPSRRKAGGGGLGSGGLPAGMSFDPLGSGSSSRARGKGLAAAAAPAAQVEAAATRDGPQGPAVPPDIFGGAAGGLPPELMALLGELEKAHLEGDAGEAGPAGGGAGGSAPGDHATGLEGTMAALRALSGGSAGPAGGGAAGGGLPEGLDGLDGLDDDAVRRLLEEFTAALGGVAAGVGGAPGQGGEHGSEGGADEAVHGLVDSVMHKLLSKEVLYEPMKQIGSRYPEWLAANAESLEPSERERYERQHGYIQQICAAYEGSPDDFPQLVDLLQQMQACGQPPEEFIRELAPELELDEEGRPTAPGVAAQLPPDLANCVIQ